MDIRRVPRKSDQPADKPKPSAKPPAKAPAVAPPAAPPAATAVPAKKPHSCLKVLVILFIILLILAAGTWAFWRWAKPKLFKSVSNQISNATGGQVNVTDKGVSVQDKSGQNSYSNNSLPSDFPSDVPIYTGASVVSSAKVSANNFEVVLKTHDSSAKVVDFYKTNLAKNGWQPDPNGAETSDGGLTTLSYKKDNRTVNVAVGAQAQGGDTGINIAVTPSQ